MKRMNKLTLGSLLDGSGGFPLGGLISGITPLWASEIEPFPIRVTTKRMPFVKHYGDISKMNGGEIEPVDIITFGSPCQDMSIAGKRNGLSGSRSSLFYEAIRIIKEMRCKTNGKYPRFIVWENVPGAFSSNKGDDFKAVIEEICKIKDESLSVPKPTKWNNAGKIMGDDFSVAWRVFDAQFWGVPQRRKRIYLVADFGGNSSGKILFESEGLSGYSSKSISSWKTTTSNSSKGTGNTSISIDGYNGSIDKITSTLGVNCGISTGRNGIMVEDIDSILFENHGQDTRFKELEEIAPTVLSTYGTGGNNQPFVVSNLKSFDVRLTSEGTKNARANVYETDVSRTLDTGGTTPDRNQGGVAVVSYGIGRPAMNQGYNAKFSFQVEEEVEPTIVAAGASGVAHPVYSSSKASFFTSAEEEKANTLVATDYKDPPIVNEPQYIVRRLTPTECARLQGFPDWWCSELETEKPTDEEISFWREVFETHRLVIGKSTKPKSDNQIMKWLKNPHSDSAEYKMWGNGVALPNVVFVLSGIVWATQLEE